MTAPAGTGAARRCGLLAVLVPALVSCSDAADLPHQDLVRACLSRNACGVRPYARIADCVKAYYDLHRPQGLGPIHAGIYRCVIAAGADCAAVHGCFGSMRGGTRCDRSFAASCQGSRARSCDLIAGQIYEEDCGAAGLACELAASFEARCTPSSCQAGFQAGCQGERLQSCGGGLIELTDCAALGQTCSPEASACAGRGETCGAGAGSCDGEVAVYCVGGRLHRQPCADQPYRQRCQDGRCVEAGAECLDELDRCAGAELEACLEGRWQRFGCAALGFFECHAATTGAACTPAN